MRLFSKKQLEVIKFASKDETRMGLNGVYVDGEITVATDGHKLLMVKSVQRPADEWPLNGVKWSDNDKPFVIPFKTVEKVLKNIPKKVDLPILKSVAIGLKEVPTGEPDSVICQTTDRENTDNVEARINDGKFPKYKQIIPDFKDSRQYQRVGISAGYLKEVCTILEGYNPKSKGITLYLKKDQPSPAGEDLGENYAVVVTADDGEGTEATAIIMPQRL